MVDAQPGQARRLQAWRTYSGRPLTPRLVGFVGVAHDAELGADHRLVAAAGQAPGPQAPHWCAGRTCRRCRRRSRRGRAPGGSWRSTRRRHPVRRSRTCPCSRGPGSTPSNLPALAFRARSIPLTVAPLVTAGPGGEPTGSVRQGSPYGRGAAAAESVEPRPGVRGDRLRRARRQQRNGAPPPSPDPNSARSSWVPPAAWKTDRIVAGTSRPVFRAVVGPDQAHRARDSGPLPPPTLEHRGGSPARRRRRPARLAPAITAATPGEPSTGSASGPALTTDACTVPSGRPTANTAGNDPPPRDGWRAQGLPWCPTSLRWVYPVQGSAPPRLWRTSASPGREHHGGVGHQATRSESIAISVAFCKPQMLWSARTPLEPPMP